MNRKLILIVLALVLLPTVLLTMLAARALQSWDLVVRERLSMNAGAAVAARLDRVVYGAADLEGGAVLSLYNVCADPRLNHQMEVDAGVRAEAASELLRSFFGSRR